MNIDTLSAATQHSAPVLRQTQGIIGVLILAGLLAGFFIHPAWMIVPGFVGAGLIIAGLTGVCPMALLVARMPWNKGA